MPLSFGRKVLAIPGPTTVPDETLQAMHRPAIDIYGGDLVGMTDSLLADLKTIFGTTEAKTYIYIANGHGGWEAAISNTLSRGDKVLVLESGRFAVGWGETAGEMGCEVEILHSRPRRAVDPAAVEARLREDAAHEIKAILVVQIDTASGVVNDIPAIRAAMDAADHPALLMVDCVASVGCMPFHMDAWGVDLAMTGSQKGLMSPPGLALMAAGPRARAMVGKGDLRTHYWDWEFREGEIHYQKYCGTPPEHLMFALRRSLDMLLHEEGLERAWTRHRLLASATRAAIDVWSAGGALEFNITEPSERGDTVTLVRVNEGYDGEALRRFAEERCGVTLGLAIGGMGGPGGGFRVAHMGHVNAPTLLGVLGVIELAMQALAWPAAAGGVEAAVKTLAAAPELKVGADADLADAAE